MKWMNWAGNQSTKPLGVSFPHHEDGIRRCVLEASQRGQRLKVVGTGHSCSAIAAPDETRMLSLSNLQELIHLDKEGFTATFDAATPLHKVNIKLDEEQLALSNLGTISAQTLAGAMATATHGSGLNYGVLPTSIRSLRLIRADGELVDINAEGSSAFAAAGVSLGSLGVITRMTIACEPVFNLHLQQEATTLESIEKRFDTLLENEHCKFLWIPHTNMVVQWIANRTKAAVTQTSSFKDWWRARCLGNTIHEMLLLASLNRSTALPSINKWMAEHFFSHADERVDKSYRIFNIPITIRQRVLEYAIPLEHTFAALHAISALLKEKNLYVHAPIEIRFANQDSFWLSPAFGRQVCFIGVIMYRPFGLESAYKDYFCAVDEIMRRFDGRPHWGKIFNLDRQDFAAQYPKWEEFAALRKSLDPKGMFLNPFLKSLFA
jgi:L-gulonolactone oxidase